MLPSSHLFTKAENEHQYAVRVELQAGLTMHYHAATTVSTGTTLQ